MRARKIVQVVIVVGATHFNAAGVTAQVCGDAVPRGSLAPAAVHDTEGSAALGLKGSFRGCRTRHDTSRRYSFSSYLAGSIQGVVPFTDIKIPQSIEGSIDFGISWCLCERRPFSLDDDPDDPEATFYNFHRGYLGLGARAQYETSADLDEGSVVGGAELRYVNPLKPFLPSLLVVFDFVKPTTSDVRDLLDLEKEAHSRLAIRGYWTFLLGSKFSGEIDAAYYRAFGLDEVLAAQGWDEGPYAQGTLGFDACVPLGPTWLQTVFLSYSHGERPTEALDRRAVTLGAAVVNGRAGASRCSAGA